MNLSLMQALRADASPSIAFSGAGGKTTAMFQLARQLPSPVIVTATAHLGAWQIGLADQHIMTETPAALEELEHGLRGVILVTGVMDGDRTKPINIDRLNWLQQFCGYHSIPLLIEADGSRGKPLKAWAEHEPPIPTFVEMVVQVVGLTSLGKPLSEENVHRHQLFSQLSGLRYGEQITTASLIRVLAHTNGGLRNIPTKARRVVLLNQADTDELQAAAQRLSQPLLQSYHAVVISSIQQERVYAVHEPVAGIILAAGASTRFGKTKQLLDWKGEPFVRVVARTALAAGLVPVVVVTGANAEGVTSAVDDLEVRVTHNAAWESGQGSSIREGVRLLTSVSTASKTPLSARIEGYAGGAIFLLADQPQVTTAILRALIEKHAEGLFPVVAPMVTDRRANPVLFDRVTFPELLNLEGDVGGRALFHKHHVEYLPWHDERLLLDVDTPEMYRRLISDETL